MKGGKDPGIGDLSLVEKRNRGTEKAQAYARRFLFNTEFLFIRCDKQYHQVVFADILYCMAKNRFCLVVTKYQTYIACNSLSEVEANLPSHQFVKIHMCYTVSIARIHSFTRTTLRLHDPGADFKKGYADRVDFKIGLTYQSTMRDPLLIVVGRSGGDPYRFAKDLQRTKMDVIEEELTEHDEFDGGAIIQESVTHKRKKAKTGIKSIKKKHFKSKGYTIET